MLPRRRAEGADAPIGRLELTAGRPEAAVGELRDAVARADAIDLLWMRGWARVDLAIALHRCGGTGAARESLAEAQALAERSGALRGLTARTGRRTLAAMVRGARAPLRRAAPSTHAAAGVPARAGG